MKISYQNSIGNFPFNSKQKDDKANYANFDNKQSTSFRGLDQMAERFANGLVSNQRTQKILSGHTLNKFLKMSIENPGLYEAFIALLVTCTARPLTILATPGAKMEDKEYASAHSIASGVSGLAFAYAAFGPITKAIDNILINVNGKNVKSAFENFYRDEKNADLISELVSHKIIPDKATFDAAVRDDKNLFGFLKGYLKENGKQYIDQVTSSDDASVRQGWTSLATRFSDKIKESFEAVKNNGVPEKKKYLIHDSLEFMKEGAYKLKTSAGADKAKFLINYTSKIILFPLTAGVTIWAIPKIMRLVFPNHKRSRRRHKNKQNAPAPSVAAKPETLKTSPDVKSQNAPQMQNIKGTTFSNFNTKAQSVSFAGGSSVMSSITKIPGKIYENGYQKPLATGLSKIFDFIAGSKLFSNRVNHLLTRAEVNKYGMKVFDRDKAGKIISKWDNDFFASNLPQIAALFGSSLYIFNTIRNKEIDPERKPTLCTNMAIVAMFSLLATKAIDRVATPIFDALKKTHSRLMDNKLNYDHEAAWKCARQLLTVTFAFRYLGPVLATPLADKVVRLFNNNRDVKPAKKC
ncbi:MAG: hypothetical protein K6A44_04665 [bacterium]|nr:hypothetical protein [bacterium]